MYFGGVSGFMVFGRNTLGHYTSSLRFHRYLV